MAKDEQDPLDVEHIRKEPRPDFSKPPPPAKLPKELQDTLNSDEKLWEALYEGTAGESTDSKIRYAAYASRFRTILVSAHRYVAYTSDVGESFRPVAHPYLIRGAYAVSWGYLAGDVLYEGYKAYLRNQRLLQHTLSPPQSSDKPADHTGQSRALGERLSEPQTGRRVPPLEDYRTVMAQRAIFQGLASMGLPAVTIHSIVRYSGKALKDAKNPRIRTWGPIGLGLAVVPFLPYVFDKPVEHAVEWTFHKAFETLGGPQAVGDQPERGRQELRQRESKAIKGKEL